MKARAVFGLLRDAAKDFNDDEAFTQGAALAFYTSLSLGPLAVVFLVATEAFGGGMREPFIDEVRSMVGPVGGEALDQIVKGADESIGTRRMPAFVAFAAAAFSATAVFIKLQQALNHVWNVEAVPGWNLWAWVKQRLMSFAMLAGIGFLLVVSLVVSTGLAMLFTDKALSWRIAELVASVGVYTLLFMLVFRILPDVRISWRETWIGALITSTLFAAGKYAIGTYLGVSSMGRDYGAAGSLLVLLVWVYWSSVIVLFGAEVTQTYVNSHRDAKPKGPAKKTRK